MKIIDKIEIEDIHEYLKYWYDDSLSDFNMAMDSGYTEYAAYILESAGVFRSPNMSDNPKIEKAIVKMLKKYKPNRDWKELFKNAIVYENKDNNETVFVKNDYVDYLVSKENLGKGKWVRVKL
jgi:hypothetical protein